MSAQSIPAPQISTKQLIQSADQDLMYVVTRPERVFVRGKGSYLWDHDGRRYLDLLQGWAVNSLGHNPPALVRALRKQAGTLINASPALYNQPMIEFARLLTEASCLDKVFFASTGAEANEGAVKLARKYGQLRLNGAHEIVTTWQGFHGRTLGMMSASGKKPWDGLFEPKVSGFTRVDFNDLEAMTRAVGPRTCAVMLEPVQGEGGVNIADKSYLQGVRQLCDEWGILLILDEIQTGMGRTGSLFAYEQYGIEPDIMTLGKGIGGGFPLAALLAKARFCVFEAGDQGGTYCAQPLAMVAGLTVLTELLEKKIPAKSASRGKHFKKRLRGLQERFGLKNIRGMGLLVGVDLPADKGPEIVAECMEKGLLINAPKPGSLRFMPALNISNAQVDEAVDILSSVLAKVL